MTLYLQHPVLFQAPIDRPARDAERRRRGLLVVLVKRQGPQDQLLFDLGELWDGAARLGDRRRLAGGEAGQVGEGDLLARAHREARSMRFSSSRTLPGKSYAWSAARASGVVPRISRRKRRLKRRMKWFTSGGMSSRRERSGGRVTRTTLRR